MKRVALFLATNLAIVLVPSISMRLPGVEPYLNEQGFNLNAHPPLVERIAALRGGSVRLDLTGEGKAAACSEGRSCRGN